MNLHPDKIFGVGFEAQSAHFVRVLWSDALHLHANQFIDAEVGSNAAHVADVVRCDSLHPHSNEFIYSGFHSQVVNIFYVGWRDTLNLHGDQFICRQVLKSGRLHAFQIGFLLGGLLVVLLFLFSLVAILVFAGLLGRSKMLGCRGSIRRPHYDRASVSLFLYNSEIRACFTPQRGVRHAQESIASQHRSGQADHANGHARHAEFCRGSIQA